MQEIEDELHNIYGELKSFPSDAHWFCPKQSDFDEADYDDLETVDDVVDLTTKDKRKKDARERQNAAYKFSLIFGLDAGDAGDTFQTMLDFYTQRLNELLTVCDKCVRNYHMGRKAYLKSLAESFDDDTIGQLSERINTHDFARIDRGLKSAEAVLSTVDPPSRTQKLLISNHGSSLQALYEALCCVDYHMSEEKLSGSFNFVFTSLQSKRPLKLGDVLPANAYFLFDRDPIRVRFAKNGWEKKTNALTETLFNWVVHDALTSAMNKVSPPASANADIQHFWEGVLMILTTLNEDLVRHSLRAMEVQPNLYFLALQHLTCNSPEILHLVIQALLVLITLSPKDFWEAFGTISPATVAEQIFVSPAFEALLIASSSDENGGNSPAISWITSFIESLPPMHQHDACRSLLHHLFERLQETRIPEKARMACCRAGLLAISSTLATFNQSNYVINPSTSLVVISDILSLVNKNIEIIVGCADLGNSDNGNLELKNLGMKVVGEALALHSKSVSAEFKALSNDTIIQRGNGEYSQSIWQSVLDIFRPGNVELAKSILAATSDLTGIDELRPKNKRNPQLPSDHVAFNKDLTTLHEMVSRIFERLSDFQPSDLRQLYQTPASARPLFAALVSADQAIYEAAVEVIKAMTEQSGKRDAMSNVLEQSFTTMLNSLSFANMKVTKARTFGPVTHLIKTSRDVLEGLCGSTGVLRARTSMSREDQQAVFTWWTTQWRALDMIFSQTEPWVTRVNQPTKDMEEFCRDDMEYAEALFDSYSIMAATVADSSSENSQSSLDSNMQKSSRRKFLEIVCHNVNGLTMMLRLRDKYLVSVISSLLSKLLRCLGEFDMEMDEFALTYIKDACRRENEKDFKRTNLTSQQKAELQRALEEHQGVEVLELQPVTIKKQATIDAWSKSAGGKIHEPTMALKKDSDRTKSILDQMKARQQQAKPSSDFLKNSRQKAAEEKKQRDAAAIAKAKALRGPTTLVPGEGSGLKDLGVLGKDHAPVRSEIMVGSSDEDSDEDSDDEDETNALVKRRKAISKTVSDYEESRRRALKAQNQGPVKKTKIQRSAKDLRARVEPNMDRLYLEILNWDIFHKGDTPPSNNEYRKIAPKFQDLSLYKQTFFPLLISEVWKSLVAAKEENNHKPVEIKVLNRASVDKFMEVSTNMPIAMNRDLKLSERDIVLMSKSEDPMNDLQAPHCLARVDRRTNKKDVVEISYRISRECDPKLLQGLGPNCKVNIVKLADMTTTQREYAALSSLEYYDLCNEVLEAKPSPLQKYSEEKTASISTKYNLNKGQAQAILSANDNDGFTLIQGPPGSGKTKTIVAMVGALLTPALQTQGEQYKLKPQGAPTASSVPKKKLLICAPSNAAVDELVLRLKDGIQPLNGPFQKINVIRIGRSDAINASVKDVMLDELVTAKLEGDRNEKKGILSAREKLHQEAGQIKQKLGQLTPLLDEARKQGDKATELKLQRERDNLIRTRNHVNAKIDADKESGNTVTRENEINRRKFQQEIIDGAHVLCATLSGSGHDMFKNLSVEFDSVIIDEAAQCIELSALIPLKYGCSKAILVGDPEQLPPTVLSRSAQSFGYEQSLFVRMQINHPKDVHLLDTQYRMHPEISRFPSKQFYHSRLVDGNGMAKLRTQPWHASTILGPYRFFDVQGVQTKEARGHSFINVPELNAAIRLYERLKADYSTHDFKGKIGIIATYKAQLNELRNRFSYRFGEAIFDEIEFNTTDAFQGREREIIIFSCVRATASGGIGFLADIRRMNVGLTRAKSSLWVLGDSRSLQQGEFWNRLIEDAKSRDRYSGGDIMNLFARPTSRRKIQSPEPSSISAIPETTALDGHASTPAEPKVLIKREEPLAIQPKIEDPDVDMVDVHSMSSSRKSSLGIESTTASEAKSSGKRTREPSTDSESSAKPIHPLSNCSTDPIAVKKEALNVAPIATPDIVPAPRTAPARPPPGLLPPRRKKPPADPFIQRKPPGRR
ncbi:hypothetical protein BP5796_01844 [Coleophoma crateriformis]|uniref:Uncharacterized protein n=1 Tax=Coleophoma crateriformis TaxID=565419 RepID=A0A3D8T1N9_9HELO|nr:hypothetical protein BP5796_01844 [Coleophoma crateriformis]